MKVQKKSATLKSFNKFITNYDTLRPFLRYISYGCYHKSYIAKRLGQSERTYEDNWKRLCSCLPDDRRQSVRHGRIEIHSLKGDAYRGTGNFLARTYGIRAIHEKKAVALLVILQILAAAKRPLTISQIQAHAIFDGKENLPLAIETCKNRTWQRYVKELREQGVLRAEKGRTYRLADNPFESFSTEEICALIYAIRFYRDCAILAVPGHFLEAKLRTMCPALPTEQEMRPLFQFKHAAFTRILDDEILHAILFCMEEKTALTFLRAGRKRQMMPLAVITDFYVGRQYMLAAEHVKNRGKIGTAPSFHSFVKIRIEDMQDAAPQPLGEKTEVPLLHEDGGHVLRLDFFYKEKNEREELERRIRRRFPEAFIEVVSVGVLRLHLKVHDELSLMPWMRTFYPQISVCGTSRANLQNRMENDLKEALENYGIHPSV